MIAVLRFPAIHCTLNHVLLTRYQLIYVRNENQQYSRIHRQVKSSIEQGIPNRCGYMTINGEKFTSQEFFHFTVGEGRIYADGLH